MSPRILLESSRGQFWENCRNRVRGGFGGTAKPSCAMFPAHPPSPMSPRVRPPAGTLAPSSSRRHRHVPSTWPTSTHPSHWFSRATNKLHADPPWRQEWITTRPSSGPSIWAALLHRTVVRSGLQCHRKVSRLRMVVCFALTSLDLLLAPLTIW